MAFCIILKTQVELRGFDTLKDCPSLYSQTIWNWAGGFATAYRALMRDPNKRRKTTSRHLFPQIPQENYLDSLVLCRRYIQFWSHQQKLWIFFFDLIEQNFLLQDFTKNVLIYVLENIKNQLKGSIIWVLQLFRGVPWWLEIQWIYFGITEVSSTSWKIETYPGC